MRFSTFTYLTFLAAVVALHWVLPRKLRPALLVLASWTFYASWSPSFLPLLVGLAAFAYLGGRWIDAGTADRRARAICSTVVVLVVLATFRYVLPATVPGDTAWIVPLGISFYSFEALSYLLDVYRRRQEPRSFLDLQLFLAFFPKLVAGPIVRAHELFPQLDQRRALRADDVVLGARELVIGLFFKTVLADGLAPLVDGAFAGDPRRVGFVSAWTMAAAFSLQLYFDFAGYSRIAIGSARLFALVLPENFDHPYAATSPPETWRRWHMSLSRWIRDYVHFPLLLALRRDGASPRVELWSGVLATVSSMVLFGLWHGATPGFLAWGLYLGLLLAGWGVAGRWLAASRLGELATHPAWSITLAPLGWVLTRAAMFLAALFFRSGSLEQAWTLIGAALDPSAGEKAVPALLVARTGVLLLGCVVVALLRPLHGRLLRGWETEPRPWGSLPRLGLAAGEGFVLGLLFAAVLVCFDGHRTFVYFQF